MNTQNERLAPAVLPVRFFVKCSGETNERIMRLLGLDNENDIVYPNMHCTDGDHNLIELVGFEKLATVVKNKGFADLDIGYYVKIGNDLPGPVVFARESDFEALVLKRFEEQTDLAAETAQCFLCPPPATVFKPIRAPEPPRVHGVLPNNVLPYRPRPGVQAIANRHQDRR